MSTYTSQEKDLRSSIHKIEPKKQPLALPTKFLPINGLDPGGVHPKERDYSTTRSSINSDGERPLFHSDWCSDIDVDLPHSALNLASKQTKSTSSKDNIAMENDMRLENWPLRCSYVLKELLETERVYVHDLSDIVNGYLSPMYSHLLSSGGNPNFIQTVFNNIIKIHQLHIELFEVLQSTLSDPHEFGLVFVQWDFLTQYTTYCTGYSKGNKLLEKLLHEDQSLREFIEQCQKDVGHSLSLSSHLIKPVQRILRYRLLLGELVKYFDSEHSAYGTLKKSPSKSSPSAVAKKRTLQLRDLQRSRTTDARTAHIEHIVQHSYLMLRSKELPKTRSNDSPLLTKQKTGYTYLQSNRTSYQQPSVSSAHQARCVSIKNHRHSSGCEPCVHELKTFFEKLAISGNEGQSGKKTFLAIKGNWKSENISPKSERL